MTPNDLLARLQALLKAHQYSEAVELTSRHFPSVRAQRTPEQAVRLHEIMHIVDTDDVPEVQHPTKMQAAAQMPPLIRV